MKIKIEIGAMAPRLSKQLKSQGITLDKHEELRIQKALDAVTVLRVNSAIGNEAAQKINLKIIRKLMKLIKESVYNE